MNIDIEISFVCRCSKKFPEADPSIQIETHLDVSLRNWRLAELSCIADDVRNLRDDVTDMNEAIEELEMKLCTLKKLAVDVRTPHSVLS